MIGPIGRESPDARALGPFRASGRSENELRKAARIDGSNVLLPNALFRQAGCDGFRRPPPLLHVDPREIRYLLLDYCRN